LAEKNEPLIYGLRQIDREIAEEEAGADAPKQKNDNTQAPQAVKKNDEPLSTAFRPEESLTVTVMRNFLEELRARRKQQEQSSQPPPPTGT
jgi:hypothetical protein